jgi:hypothetical protein
MVELFISLQQEKNNEMNDLVETHLVDFYLAAVVIVVVVVCVVCVLFISFLCFVKCVVVFLLFS